MGMEHWAWEHPVEEAAVEEWDHRSGRLWVGWGVWSLQQGFGERMLWDRRWGMSSGAICRVRERQAGSIGVVWGGATNLESLCEQGTHTQTTPFLPLHSTFDFPLIRRLNLTKAPHHLAALWLTYSVPFTFAHCPAFLQGAWYLENKLLKYLRIQASGQRKQWHKLRPPPPPPCKSSHTSSATISFVQSPNQHKHCVEINYYTSCFFPSSWDLGDMGESQVYQEQGGLADVTEEVKILLGMGGKLFIRNGRRREWDIITQECRSQIHRYFH